ncbi:XFP C-terminal domain-containing protein [Treponema bryantii]|uniref:XFP C-terminal domain-containing protein n=1 Tax=Treponema bryantii TaxID=163 RepID=A0A1I3IA02_9SPIR|nr:hypothetical protein [Treponema bryantii]SFI44719.1 XFP C-terminal domain-containing protein [Treponema bryantii]
MTYCCQVIRKKLISYITKPRANAGNLLKDLRTPDFKKYALKVKTPGSVKAQDMKELGNKSSHLVQKMNDTLVAHKQHISELGEDLPEVVNWKWHTPEDK